MNDIHLPLIVKYHSFIIIQLINVTIQLPLRMHTIITHFIAGKVIIMQIIEERGSFSKPECPLKMRSYRESVSVIKNSTCRIFVSFTHFIRLRMNTNISIMETTWS